MRIDISFYKHALPTIKSMMESRRYDKSTDLVSEMAIATGCPVIVCLHFIGHIKGYDEHLNNYIDRVKSFYRIESVEGVEEL